MYRSITPIAVLGASLVLAVPAFGKGQLGDPQWMQALEARSQELNRQHSLGQYDPALRALKLRSEGLNRAYALGGYSNVAANKAIEARERAFAAGRDEQPVSAIDARERAFAEKRNAQLASMTSPDVFERAVAARGTGGSTLDRFIANDNRFQAKPTNPTVAVSAAGSGSEIEWPQIGIGLGIGILLMLGLMLAVRATRHPPLAH